MYSFDGVVIDFETRSRCDLKTAGGDNYARDPSTQILCMAAICLQSGREWLWFPKDGGLPLDLQTRIAHAKYVVAHNARFDQQVWEYVARADHKGFNNIEDNKWYCSAAQCRVNALPGGLDDAARAVTKGKHRKDHKGGALIRKLSIPQEDGTFNEDPALMKAMGDYCMQDARVTAEVIKATRALTDKEHRDWLINERINDNGVKVDTHLCELATDYAAEEAEEIGKHLAKLTNGQVTKHSQHQRIRDFVLANVRDGLEPNETHKVEKLMTVYKKGEKKFSLDKSVRSNILTLADAGELDISDAVYEVVALSDAGNKSSVAKFGAMLTRADEEDDRVRGAFMYAGAGQTKRYSSKGVQVHNFRRDCLNAEDAEEIYFDMADDYEIDNVMDTLSKMLRPALIPEDGNTFVVGDWSAIEGRILPWLTENPDAEKVLNVFRKDEDIYMHTAKGMGIDDRQIGKVATLSLGYQGALGAFMNMAKNYGLHLPEAEVLRIVKKWRKANRWAVKFWADLEKAAIRAVKKPHTHHKVGRVTYTYVPEIMEGTLFCTLPDGEVIQYPFAKLEDVQSQYGTKKAVTYLKASLHPAADAKEWPRAALYGGLMAENITQAVAAALLREKLADLQARLKHDSHTDIVLHVHDEIVLEAKNAHAETIAKWLQGHMECNPNWAEGLPLKAEPEIMIRYGK